MVQDSYVSSCLNDIRTKVDWMRNIVNNVFIFRAEVVHMKYYANLLDKISQLEEELKL
jgi:hypothetical protein